MAESQRRDGSPHKQQKVSGLTLHGNSTNWPESMAVERKSEQST